MGGCHCADGPGAGARVCRKGAEGKLVQRCNEVSAAAAKHGAVGSMRSVRQRAARHVPMLCSSGPFPDQLHSQLSRAGLGAHRRCPRALRRWRTAAERLASSPRSLRAAAQREIINIDSRQPPSRRTHASSQPNGTNHSNTQTHKHSPDAMSNPQKRSIIMISFSDSPERTTAGARARARARARVN